ncbi:MAG: hypothetical protein FJW39_33100 [Acidobacteria bacterium]|nr:hypothetical protein [Acidobacteriota bacterium]
MSALIDPRARKLYELIVDKARHGPVTPKPPDTATPTEVLEACGLCVEEFYPLLASLADAGLVEVSGAYPFEEIRVKA